MFMYSYMFICVINVIKYTLYQHNCYMYSASGHPSPPAPSPRACV